MTAASTQPALLECGPARVFVVNDWHDAIRERDPKAQARLEKSNSLETLRAASEVAEEILSRAGCRAARTRQNPKECCYSIIS